MSPERETGDRQLAFGHVAVDLTEQLVDRARTAPDKCGGNELVAAPSMGDQGVDHLGHVVHESAMARAERAHRRPLVPDAGQAGEILMQIPVRRPDDDGRAVHHVVAREQQGALLHQPAQVIGGVARRLQGAQGEVARGGRTPQRPTLADPLVGGEVLGRPEADDAGAGRRGQRGGTGRVIQMGVGDHDGVDGAERCRCGHDGGGVTLVRRTGIDHDGVDPSDQIGVGAGPGHQPRIRRGQSAHARCHLVQPARLGCRTATRSPARPPVSCFWSRPRGGVGTFDVRLHRHGTHGLVEVAQ